MTEKTIKLIDFLEQNDFESFKTNLFLLISEKIEESLEDKREEVGRSILDEQDAAAAAEAEAEKQALFVDPNMAKEFFIKDVDYKEHTITLKTLGTGIGKPVIAYIDGQQFEVFPDREVAEKESKEAIDKMIEKNIDDIKDLRKSKAQLKKEAEAAKAAAAAEKAPKPEDKKSEK